MTPEPSRILALDYGSARCGCAISDPSGTLATPIDLIEAPASEAGLGAIAELVDRHEVGEIVVGIPVGLAGTEGPQAVETRAFVALLADSLDVPVHTYDERFTTRLAQRTPGSASEDSRAAAHLLTSYLDARRQA